MIEFTLFFNNAPGRRQIIGLSQETCLNTSGVKRFSEEEPDYVISIWFKSV